MPVSEDKRRANKLNSLKSTGPKTLEGKQRSRQNSFKHGFTGAGVVQAPGEAAEAARRAEALRQELKPRGELQHFLVSRLALQMTRLDHLADYQQACQDEQARHAAERFDDALYTGVETQLDWIAAEPATRARRLHETVEGVGLVVNCWQQLFDELNHPYGPQWSYQHSQRAANLMGRRPDDVPYTRLDALCHAVLGDFSRLAPPEREGGEQAVKARAIQELSAFITDRISWLRGRLAGMNPAAVEQDRAEAARRARFDPSPQAVLGRKYEGTLERSFFRTLKEFREAQAAAAEEREPDVNPEDDEVCASLGSFFPVNIPVARKPPRGASEGPVSDRSGPSGGSEGDGGGDFWPSQAPR
jgi:hypothetical protein